MGKTHKIFTSRTNVESSAFIGEAGRIFYDETSGELRLSDGVTPGGLPVAGGGSGGYTGSQGATGGYTGSAGHTGYTGYTGSRSTVAGYVGSQGIQGPAGGYTGSAGAGFTGSQGDIGFTGFTGATGYTGSIGFAGSQGYRGSVGYTGSIGTLGFTGSIGIQGYIGSASTATGYAGSIGFVGSSGAGYIGSLGYVGSGDIGYVGSVGYTGSSGYSGSNGYIGSIGYNGSLGYNGSTGYVGSGGIGYVGSSGIGFVGSTGYAGSIGFRGDTGYIGSQGGTGYIGSLGYTGSNGSNGFTGSQGDTGFIGSQGLIGPQGATGYAGSQGDTGFIGSFGATGYIGSQGIIGFTGSQGIHGDLYNTVSTSTLIIPSNGNFSIILAPELAYSVAQTIIVHAASDLADNINATVVSYNSITGELVATVNSSTGIGQSYSSWIVNLAGAVGAIGYIGSQGDTGYYGSRGDVGPQGATGFAGSIGYVGSSGDIGLTGYVGSIGSGYAGSRGSTGYVGSRGVGYVGSSSPFGGSSGQILFNNNNAATGTDNLLFDGSNLTVQGITTFNNTTTVNGDVFISNNLTVDGTINFVGSATIVQAPAGQFFGDLIGNGALYAGVALFTAFPQTVIQATGNFNGYIETNAQNVNSGPQASTDIVATADNGTTSTSYIDMGIAGSNWDGSQLNSLGTALSPNDGYVFVSGPASSFGDLVLGTITTGTQIKLVVGYANNSIPSAIFNGANTVSSSTTTGALVLTGGLGLQGNANLPVGSMITVGSDVAAVILPNVPAQFSGNVNSYFQINSQNISSGTSASTDLILTANNGNDSNFYIDLGIASSNAAIPGQEVIGANDGYLYVQGADLVIGTATTGRNIEFYTSGLSTASSTHHVMTLADNTVTIYSSLNVTGPILQNGNPIGNNVAVRIISSNSQLYSTDDMIFASGSITLQLPDATINTGTNMQIKNVDGGPITVITTNNQTIDSYTSMTLTEFNSVMGLISNGINWYII